KLQMASREGKPFTLVLLDMQMPGMDGLEVAKKVKGDPAIAKVHLVMLTSLGFRGDGPLMSQWGLAAYLIKPVRQSELHSTLLTVLGRATTNEPSQLVTRHTIAEKHGYKSMHILVAEDNAINQEVVCFLLQKFGYKVSLASNGRETVEAVTGNHYDLILMDCQMPVMDGYEAAVAIRHLERERGGKTHIPIIALTANALKGDRAKCLKAGMDDYLSKPFKQDEILAILETWSDRLSGEDFIEPIN
ncbi:MAG: response regulator, partial [Desulforhopalus sp.]